MTLRQVTQLILGMFGSFAVILTLMLIFFRPEQPAPTRPPAAGPVIRPDTTRKPAPDTAAAHPPANASEPDTIGGPDAPAKSAPPSAALSAERKIQQELQRERREMALLKAEMQRRLNDQLNLHDRKLTQLARKCETLEPGEAARILVDLDDPTLSQVMRRMDRNSALKIAAILQRLGRKNAIAIR